jgi:hypothetical protein
MLTESQIKRAKELAVKYVQCSEHIEAITDMLNYPDLNKEYKEKWESERANERENKHEIQNKFQKEFSVDLQRLEDRTVLGIISHVRQQEKELEYNSVNPNRPQEVAKEPPTQKWDVNSYKEHVERHGLKYEKAPPEQDYPGIQKSSMPSVGVCLAGPEGFDFRAIYGITGEAPKQDNPGHVKEQQVGKFKEFYEKTEHKPDVRGRGKSRDFNFGQDKGKDKGMER